MNSKYIYQNLCESHKKYKEQYVPGSGLHKHHIIPKHSGGNDDESNFTYLTVRKHIIAHYLLWRIYKNPNDLRAMHMIGANLTPFQRKITGEFCRDNEIGFFNPKYSEKRREWRKRGLESQKLSGNKNSFYWWSTEEGRKKHASMGGKASINSGNNPKWEYWMGPEGRKKRSSLGGRSHKGKKTMFKPGDKTFKRVSPDDFEQYLNDGYIFGSPYSPNKNNFKKRPVSIEGTVYENAHEASNELNLTLNTIYGRIRSHKIPKWFFYNES